MTHANASWFELCTLCILLSVSLCPWIFECFIPSTPLIGLLHCIFKAMIAMNIINRCLFPIIRIAKCPAYYSKNYLCPALLPSNTILISRGKWRLAVCNSKPEPFLWCFEITFMRVKDVKEPFQVRMRAHSIPAPPFDIVIAQAECQWFCDDSGNLVSFRTEQVIHYHLTLDALKQ